MEKIKLVYKEYIDDKEEIDEKTYLLSDGGLFLITTEEHAKELGGEWFEVDEESLEVYLRWDEGFREWLNLNVQLIKTR